MNTNFELPPKNATEQLARASRDIAAQNAAGIRAMEEACGQEFSPPADLVQAAKIIRHLRAERSNVQNAASNANSTLSEWHQRVQRDCKDAMQGNPLPEDSMLGEVSGFIGSLRAAYDDLLQAHTDFVGGVRDTLTDRGMMAIPGISGYFTGATPLFKAAEAAAVYVNASDRSVREAYLRRRGWVMTTNGENTVWRNPEGTQVLMLDAALARQVKADCEPFKMLADREWRGMPNRAEEPKIINEAMKLVPTPKANIYEESTPMADPVARRSDPIWPGGEINSFQTPEMTLLGPTPMESFIPETLPTQLPPTKPASLDFRQGNTFIRPPVQQRPNPRHMEGHIEHLPGRNQKTIVNSITVPRASTPMGMQSTAEETVLPKLGGIAGEE